ncbi:Xaa-Pro peptidase family protein [Thermostilla marina]
MIVPQKYCVRRRNNLRKALAKAKVDAILVTNFSNVTYLTGFTGDDSFLLVGADGDVIISDSRYTEQIEEECPGLQVHIRRRTQSMVKSVRSLVKKRKIGRLAVEAESMTLGLRDRLAAELSNCEIVPLGDAVERLRAVKDAWEIDRIRVAVDYAQRAITMVAAGLVPDQTEKQVADLLEYNMRSIGAKCSAFPTIVAVGARAALPHAVPTEQRIAESPILLVDWGANEGVYRSDLTRVFVTGRISPKLKRIYEVVLNAQLAGIEAIRPGVTCEEVDRAARSVIEEAGFGPKFGHGLGHGIGVDIHEAPRLSAASTTPLEPGMVVTVEPGIYIPGWGGVRIEDDVLVTPDGYEVLTTVPKSFDDIVLA